MRVYTFFHILINHCTRIDEPDFFDARVLFNDPQANTYTYTAVGLPGGSGLKLQPGGLLFGTPNAADYQASPMMLTVRSSNGAVQEMRISIIRKEQVRISLDRTVMPILVSQGQYFSKNMAEYIRNPKDLEMIFAVTGLPAFSGMHMSTNHLRRKRILTSYFLPITMMPASDFNMSSPWSYL